MSKHLQMTNGKAFEYAILREFQEKLKVRTNVQVVQNNSFNTAKQCFESLERQAQGRCLLAGSFAVNFLVDVEPRLSNGIEEDDVLQLEILKDAQGELGDVRDVLAIRLLQKWEIGVSAKNNHSAVKHSRLSKTLDFGDKWFGKSCSSQYFDEIAKVFDFLSERAKNPNISRKWSAISKKEDIIYLPILKAFKDELLRLYKDSEEFVASRLIEYLVGVKDFYKVIKRNKSIEIQAYNIHGTLNLPFRNIKPKFETPVIPLPSRIISIDFKEGRGSKTTLIVKLNNEWEVSFRIHNASTNIEQSLKFDVKLIKAPNSLFTNKLSIINNKRS